jgi:hypothetical protein
MRDLGMKRCHPAYLQYLTLHAIASCVPTTTMAAVPAVSMMAKAASITILRMFSLRCSCFASVSAIFHHVPVSGVTVAASPRAPAD